MELAGEADLTIRQGGTFILTLTLTDSDETTVLDTAGYTSAQMKVRSRKDSSTVVLELSTANGRIVLGIQPKTRTASTAYAVGVQVIPTVANGFLFRCITAGTSAASEPTWPLTPGQTVTDGTVTWQNVGAFNAATDKYNVLMVIPSSVTAALSWHEHDPQVYDLEFVSGSTEIPILAGLIFLEKEVTY